MMAMRFLAELISLPDIRVGTWRWMRHRWALFSYHPVIELMILLVEPTLTLLALGLGLGRWITEMDGHPYISFVLPAVAAISVVFIPYWETAYGVFARLKVSHGYWAALQTPLTPVDIATGEILWATVKGVMAGMVALMVGGLLGWCDPVWSGLTVIALIPGAMLFASIGLWAATSVRKSVGLLVFQSMVLGPLALWSDTIFPFSRLGGLAEILVWASPVTHIVRPIRRFCAGEISAEIFLSLAILWIVACMVANAAVMKFTRRLIPR